MNLLLSNLVLYKDYLNFTLTVLTVLTVLARIIESLIILYLQKFEVKCQNYSLLNFVALAKEFLSDS